MMAAILSTRAPQIFTSFVADALIALMHPNRDYTCNISKMLTSATAGYISSATITIKTPL